MRECLKNVRCQRKYHRSGDETDIALDRTQCSILYIIRLTTSFRRHNHPLMRNRFSNRSALRNKIWPQFVRHVTHQLVPIRAVQFCHHFFALQFHQPIIRFNRVHIRRDFQFYQARTRTIVGAVWGQCWYWVFVNA